MAAPEYRIDGFEAASDRVEDDFISVTLSHDMYVELAAQHTTDETFLLRYDRSAIWDVPGTADSASNPYRVFLEGTAPSFETYTVREGAFTSADAAHAWLRERDTPLPLAPAPPSLPNRRAAAARTRSPTSAAVGDDSPPPAAATAPAPSKGRTRRARS